MKILSILPIAVTVSGIYLLFKLRFFFVLNPKRTLMKAVSAVKGESAFSSLCLALAGTLGIGNIVGVAVGISVGGAGSVFWLFVSSLFAMIIKFSEATLSADMGGGLGMIGVIEKSFIRASRILPYIYAALVLLLSFVMGAALQSESIAAVANDVLGVCPIFSALAVMLLLLYPIAKGSERIEKITVLIIPLTTVIYIFLALSAIVANIEKLPHAFCLVIDSAFSLKSGVGGIIGFLISDTLKEGYLRGILSNEAGAGTSSLAHSKNESRDSAAVGVMGILEAFFDTVVLCMLTAFATLVSVDSVEGLSGTEIIVLGIGSVFGKISEYLLLVCIFAFAYSTVVCWYYYGRCAASYLFFGRLGRVYSLTFLFSVFLGGCIDGHSLITASDIILLFLSLISLSAVIKNSDRIRLLSEKSALIIPRYQFRERRTSTRRKYSREDLP